MRNRVHPVLIVLTLVIVLVTVAIVYSRRLPTTGAGQAEVTPMVAPMMGTPGIDEELRIQWIPWFAPEGTRIMNFLPGDTPSPLWLMGCQQGDILVSVNGNPIEGSDLNDAIAELRENGTPFTLGLVRMGREISKQIDSYPELPAAAAQPAQPEGAAAQQPATPAEPPEYLGGLSPVPPSPGPSTE
jgi:hypothetical protein